MTAVTAGSAMPSAGQAGENEHPFRIIRTTPNGDEIFEENRARDALRSGGTIAAACACGWRNPYTGPRYPDLPRAPYSADPPEQVHWRFYHLTAWSRHVAEALGEPSPFDSAEELGLNELTVELIISLRLLLDHAADSPDQAVRKLTAVEQALRGERLRLFDAQNRRTRREQVGPDSSGVDLAQVPAEVAAGVRLLLERTAGKHFNLERTAVEMAADELRRLVQAGRPDSERQARTPCGKPGAAPGQ